MKKLALLIIILLFLSVPLLAQTDSPGVVKFPTALDNADSLIRANNNATTTLSGAIGSGDTTINVASTATFPASGLIQIGSEVIAYRGKSGTAFTFCLRGHDGSSAASHSSGAAVRGTIVRTHHQTLRDVIIALETKLGTGADTPATGEVFQGTAAGASGWSPLTGTVSTGFNVGSTTAKAAGNQTLLFGNDASKPGFRWNSTTSKMQVSDNGSTWADLSSFAVTIATDTIGSDVNAQYTPGTNTWTVNIPVASATVVGKINTIAQTIGGPKTFTDLATLPQVAFSSPGSGTVAHAISLNATWDATDQRLEQTSASFNASAIRVTNAGLEFYANAAQAANNPLTLAGDFDQTGLFTLRKSLVLRPTGTAAGETGEVRLRELVANGSEYIAHKAADSVTTTRRFIWPGVTPVVDEVLTVVGVSGGDITLGYSGGGSSGFTGSNNILQKQISAGVIGDSSATDTGSGISVVGALSATTTIQPGAYTLAGLPASGTAGRIARVTDGPRDYRFDMGTAWVSLTGEVYYGKHFGMKCDDSTDDSAALQAAINAAMNANGGIIDIPPGKCRILSQITFPNDGAAIPRQRSLVIRGAGAHNDGAWTGVPYGGTQLDLRHAAGVAKIDTRGGGTLEITGLALVNDGADSIPFLQTTNTTLFLHHMAVMGSGAGGTASTNDAFVLGSTTTALDGSASAAYQGYNSEISHVYFGKVRRAVVLQTFANDVNILYNTISTTGGYSTGAAIDVEGNAAVGAGANGVRIVGNTIEVSNYKYGIRLNHSVRSHIESNGCYDSTGTTTACIRLEANGGFHTISYGYYDPGKGLSDASTGNSTIISGDQSDPTIFPNPIRFKSSTFEMKNSSSTGPLIYSNAAPTSYWYQQVEGGSGTQVSLLSVISGGGAESHITFERGSATDKRLKLSGSTNNVIYATADLKLQAGAGTTLWLGSTDATFITITGGVLTSGLGPGTAPFVVASDTKVANLNVDKLDNLDTSATPQATTIPVSDGAGKLASGWINFGAPGAIGGTTPGSGAFTTITATSTISAAGQIISTLATGTAPLVIASTTNVANLNASSLNGATFAAPGAIGSTTASSGAFTTVSATGQITSTVSTGTAPLVIASTTNIANLNASSLSGATFAAPGAIGGTTPSAGTFTTLTANTSLTVNGGQAVTKILSATSSVNFTALAANSCEDLTMAATGAAIGDVVILGLPDSIVAVDGATPRTSFTAWVSASSIVTIRRCNTTSATTADPTAGSVRVAIIQF